MKKPTRRQRVENWLRKNGHLINRQGLDREIGASMGTIQKFLKYDKKINDERIKILYQIINEITTF